MRKILYQCQCTESFDEPYNEFIWATNTQDARDQLHTILLSEAEEFWGDIIDDFDIMPVVDINGENILKKGE